MVASMHPVKALSLRQRRGDLERVLRATQQDIREAYAAAQAQGRHLAEQFASAYALELRRLNADRDEPQRRVPLTWLRTSGWGLRVTHALTGAGHEAAQASKRAAVRGVQMAAQLGHDDAKALLVRAMRPAVRAGMDWTPKEPKPPRHRR